jgi:hypothetical protein
VLAGFAGLQLLLLAAMHADVSMVYAAMHAGNKAEHTTSCKQLQQPSPTLILVQCCSADVQHCCVFCNSCQLLCMRLQYAKYTGSHQIKHSARSPLLITHGHWCSISERALPSCYRVLQRLVQTG